MQLRDIDHPYYANESNFYNRDQTFWYVSWEDYLAQRGEEDHNLNLIIRWDWAKAEDISNDLDDASDVLQLTYVLQRKGIYQVAFVRVTPEDEPAIRAYLAERWAKLQEVWEGIAQ
ncbi:MAG: hypothetical protein ACPG4T_19820 [Nannocystaceae bacterium]